MSEFDFEDGTVQELRLEDTSFDTRMERMCYRFLLEIPLPMIMKYLARLGHTVLVGVKPEAEIHCPACRGYTEGNQEEFVDCLGYGQ